MAAKKVGIIYKSIYAESLVSYAICMATERGTDLEVINASQMDASDLNAAIAGLTGGKDVIYTALTVGTDISAAQLAAIEAKLVAVTGISVQYDVTNRVAVESQAYKFWKYFNPVSVPPTSITYMSDLLGNLSVEEELWGEYLLRSIPARYNLVSGGGTITFNDELIISLTDLLDRGVYNSRINAASKGLPAPEQDSLLLHDLQMEGGSVYNHQVLEINIPRPGVASDSIDIESTDVTFTYITAIDLGADTLTFVAASTVAKVLASLESDDTSIQTYGIYLADALQEGGTAVTGAMTLLVTSQSELVTQVYTLIQAA